MAGQLLNLLRVSDKLERVECPEPVEGLYWLYILLLEDKTFYIGQSANVAKRLERHRKKIGAFITKRNRNIDLVYTEGPMKLEKVIKRERQLKQWSYAKKVALIKQDFVTLRALSKSREE